MRTVNADTRNTTTVQLYNIGDGQTSLTNESIHTSSYAAKLVIPSSAQQGSGCMALYPYNKTLNSLQSFQVYTSYTNATPRFVILLDTSGDGSTDLVLLSDYQFTSKGDWQITQGGQRWGWSEASPQLSIYGKTWDILSYWKGIYGNATVLSVGVVLEYCAVKDSNGLNQPLYADELVLNGITYNIASPPNQPSNVSTSDDWPMYRQNLQRSGLSTSTAPPVIKYSLTSSISNLNIDFRFRNNHFSRYQLDMIESSPVFAQHQPNDVIQNAKGILARYQAYSGDTYLTDMSNLLTNVTAINNAWAILGNLKLQITVSGGSTVFLWMYTQDGIDYQTKGLQMTFQNNLLTTMTDGYFLFTVGSTDLAFSQNQAVNIAKSYVNTLTWTIEGKQVSGFNVANTIPLSVQLVPHTRGNSVALIPYWYVGMKLDKIYAGGINEVAIGIYADTGQVADVQMLSTNTET
ncbi:hypothetical protein IMZ68_04400 [Candidatus Bathyarchaeota archaeon]|nr:hypothetical protein [Candidatus Bathyarchaeota archaeon]